MKNRNAKRKTHAETGCVNEPLELEIIRLSSVK